MGEGCVRGEKVETGMARDEVRMRGGRTVRRRERASGGHRSQGTMQLGESSAAAMSIARQDKESQQERRRTLHSVEISMIRIT